MQVSLFDIGVVISAVLLVLKLAGVGHLTWLVVALPALIGLALTVAITLLILAVFVIEAIVVATRR